MPKKNYTNRDFAIPIAWQNSWIKGEGFYFHLLKFFKLTKQLYFKVGHAAILIVNHRTGDIEYSDFGRFTTPKGKGRARTFETDPLVRIPFKAIINPNGDIENIEGIALFIASIPHVTYGKGPVTLSICKNMDFVKMKKYIKKVQSRGGIRYGVIGLDSTNCANYIRRVLYRGCCERNRKLKLLFGLLFFSSPITNVTRSNSYKKVFELDNGMLIEIMFSTFSALMLLYMNIFKSLLNSEVPKGGWPDNVSIPSFRHQCIPENAQWLGGIVEGSWFHLEKKIGSSEEEYHIKAFLVSGLLKFEIIATISNTSFDLQLPFHFEYNCNRLINTVVQNKEVYVFHWKSDVPNSN